MPHELQGNSQIGNNRFGIVVSRFNTFITAKLLTGALDCLGGHGAKEEQITVAHVPGAFEVPLAAKKLAKTGNFDALICLATVIRGETDHYTYVCQQITQGVGEVSLATGVPTLFGVITCDTLEQAIDRAGGERGNIGFNAAAAAIEMVALIKEIDRRK